MGNSFADRTKQQKTADSLSPFHYAGLTESHQSFMTESNASLPISVQLSLPHPCNPMLVNLNIQTHYREKF